MSILGALGSIGPVAKVLLKALELVDPKTRDWVHKRKALEFGEKYILCNIEIRGLEEKKLMVGISHKEERRLKNRLRYLRYYCKWFFEND